MNGFYDRLILAVIPDSFACCVDTGADCRILNVKPMPYSFNQIVFGHQPALFVNERAQQFKHLRLNVDRFFVPQKCVPFSVERAIGKVIDHGPLNSLYAQILKMFP